MFRFLLFPSVFYLCMFLSHPGRLKLVKFTNVTVLNIFIESNQGGEETTKVQKIALFGQTGDLDKFNVAGEPRCG